MSKSKAKWILKAMIGNTAVYIEDSVGLSPEITDLIENARVFSVAEDNPDTKIKFYNSVTGLNFEQYII